MRASCRSIAESNACWSPVNRIDSRKSSFTSIRTIIPTSSLTSTPFKRRLGVGTFTGWVGAIGGSFKGIDITFGMASRERILIRAWIHRMGGSSLALLARRSFAREDKCGTVAELDAIVGRQRIWDRLSPLKVVESPAATSEIVSARDGPASR
jgi:hypothetical protein